MNRLSFLQDLLSSFTERSLGLLTPAEKAPKGADGVMARCDGLLSSRGEASGVALARQVLTAFFGLEAEAKRRVFHRLAENYGPDPKAVADASAAYLAGQTAENLEALLEAAEPPRQELFRRLNLAPGGTARLVAMRKALLAELDQFPALAPVDRDLRHLFSSWFNRGFLVLRRIDWRTPANILEKIIEHEAVHEISDWEELRRRIEPPDRRCFAFFHPALGDEPLIFVEVALMNQVPASIGDVLRDDREVLDDERRTVAVFYSISNCQEGLRGITFGNFLIKQVVDDLSGALASLNTFVTLSPAPGFTRWLKARAGEGDGEAVALNGLLADSHWNRSPARAAEIKSRLMPLAGAYFLEAKRDDGQPPDPVARFHLGNGASLDRVNWLGDASARGLAGSAGLMVNYLYDLDRIEANHEAYRGQGQIAASRDVRSLLSQRKPKKAAEIVNG